MKTSIRLTDLTLESSVIDNVAADQVAIVDETPSPIHTKEFDDMMLVFETYETIIKRKYICRSDMENIKGLTGTYPTLGKLVDKYPINSFTQEPSRVNYDISTESFVKTAYEAVVNALGDLLAYVINAITKLWVWLSQSGQQTAAVDDIESKLATLQKYIVEVDKILSNSSVAPLARRVRDGAAANELRNVNGKWNSFKDRQFFTPAKQLDEMMLLSGVIKTKLGPFTEAVEGFLTSLSLAQTEGDIETAIARLELFDITSVNLVQLAASYGYSSRSMQISQKLSSFESMASYIKGAYRSQINERTSIKEENFKEALVSYKTAPWAGEITSTISWARARTDPILKKVKEFDTSVLKAGMEDVYIKRLAPFMKALSSVLTGFVAISQCMGYLTDTRNAVSYTISKSTLNIVKKMDTFSIDNKSKLTLIENAAIGHYRRDVSSVIKG